jgi:DNA-binding NtrC family response regulator
MANILVVDDEIGIRELLSEILSDEGHVVVTAESAARARDLRVVSAPDLVLLDIWMPDTDGVSLLKEWIAGGLMSIPVIMMSGHATLETAGEATRLGALDFLEKPITLSRLLGAVREGLEHGQRMRTPRPAAPARPEDAQRTRAAGAPQSADAASARDAGAREASGEGSARESAGASLAGTGGLTINLDQPLREARDQFERAYFEYQLAKEGYSMTRVADRAGLERTHLYRKLKQLGVELGRNARRTERFEVPRPASGRPPGSGFEE